MGPSEWLLARPGSTKQAGDLNGKLLISCCTPLNEGFSGLIIGTNDSGAKTIQRMAPGAHVVEAFYSVFVTILESGDTHFGDRRTQIFYCGDEEAKKVVARLMQRLIVRVSMPGRCRVHVTWSRWAQCWCVLAWR
jgi:predicted dinucleotide-binding enzyme